MFLANSDRTQFDLSWRMFGFPVRVSPWFWVTTLMLGWSYQRYGFEYLLIWVACVFVSILIHELGHAFAFRLFGFDSHILLTSFCGLTFGSGEPYRRWQRIAVSLAGPAADFVLGGLVYVAMKFHEVDSESRSSQLVAVAMLMLIWINLFWGLLNLLPIWPLDGGQVSREVCQHFSPRNGQWTSLVISLVTAAALSLNAIASMLLKREVVPYLGVGDLFMVIFFGLFAAQSWFELQQLGPRAGGGYRREYEREDRAPWEQDPDAWKRGG